MVYSLDHRAQAQSKTFVIPNIHAQVKHEVDGAVELAARTVCVAGCQTGFSLAQVLLGDGQSFAGVDSFRGLNLRAGGDWKQEG